MNKDYYYYALKARVGVWSALSDKKTRVHSTSVLYLIKHDIHVMNEEIPHCFCPVK
jgi:hypothetical protein